MNIEIQAPNIEVSDLLNELINKKVNKLGHFYDHIMDAIVFLRDNGVNSKEVEIKVNVKNNTLFCKEKDENFEKALDSAVEAMKRSLKKYKEKIQEK